LKYSNYELDVVIVNYGAISEEVLELVDKFRTEMKK